MIKRLVIHLGDCKTGSTSIQSILSNKSYKSEQPDSKIEYPCVFNHSRLVKSLDTKKFSHQKEKIFTNINRRFHQSNADVGIISAEQFEFSDPEILKNALSTYLPDFASNIQLIAYIRPHADRILASYAERVKKGAFIGSPSQFLDVLKEKKILSYAPRIKRWKDSFGEKYQVRPFTSSALLNGDVVHDFFFTIFTHNEFSFLEPTRHNESVTVEDLSVLRYIQKILLDDSANAVGHARLGSFLAQIMVQFPPKEITKFRLYNSLAIDLIHEYMDDAKEVDEKYFHEPILQAALTDSSQRAIKESQSLEISSYFNDSSIRLINCWVELYKSLIQQNPEYFLKSSRRPGRTYNSNPI
tara:strand:- start:7709 stop:8776 length:1068 start_codon:yes stop_codon:yes gene_type:complete